MILTTESESHPVCKICAISQERNICESRRTRCHVRRRPPQAARAVTSVQAGLRAAARHHWHRPDTSGAAHEPPGSTVNLPHLAPWMVRPESRSGGRHRAGRGLQSRPQALRARQPHSPTRQRPYHAAGAHARRPVGAIMAPTPLPGAGPGGHLGGSVAGRRRRPQLRGRGKWGCVRGGAGLDWCGAAACAG